jgi:hypothetical protein
MLGVQHVNAEMAEGGPEEVLLGGVFEQGTLEGRGGHLLVDRDGLFVVGQLGGVLGHFEDALVSRRVGFLASEVVARLLVVPRSRLQVGGLRLVNFSNRLKATEPMTIESNYYYDRNQTGNLLSKIPIRNWPPRSDRKFPNTFQNNFF